MAKLIIFDMDGVIFDSIPTIFAYQSYKYPTLTVEDHRESMRHNGSDGYAKHVPLERSREQREADSIRYAKEKLESKVFDGIIPLLADLHAKGNILALNTNAYSRNALPLLEKAGLSPLFDFLATRDVSDSKVEKFRLIGERYGKSPEETVFVTDSINDVKEANIAGIPAIAATWGVHDRGYFEREEGIELVAIVDTVDELRSFII